MPGSWYNGTFGEDPVNIPDPGNTGTITATAMVSQCAMTSAGTETRTLANPVKRHQRLLLYAEDTSLGNITVSNAREVDPGSTDMIFSGAARGCIELICILHAGLLKWQGQHKNSLVAYAGA